MKKVITLIDTRQSSTLIETKNKQTHLFHETIKRFTVILLLLVSIAFVPNRLNAQFTQQGSKLVGMGANGVADQGYSVSLSSDGNTAIVGGSGDKNSKGAVWIYIRKNGVWRQQGRKLVGTGAVGSLVFQGSAVAISSDGNTAIEGAWNDNSGIGAAWVFTRTGGVWTQQGSKLVGTGAMNSSEQGESVSISGDGNTAIVGGYGDNGGVGAAWVYTRTNGVWTQQGSKLVGTGAANAAAQGRSVSLSYDGNTAIVGGLSDNNETNSGDIAIGAVWVYTRTGGVWTQQGNKLVGTGVVIGAYQGTSVSLSSDGNTAIEGGWDDNSGVGAAWVFTRTGGVWAQQGGKLVGTGAVGGARQGWSVSISSDGNKAIVGGFNDNSSIGAAWVYTRTGGVWTQQGSKLVGTGAVGSSDQGNSVSISSDGNTAMVGGPGDNGGAGAAWVYSNSNTPDLKNMTEQNTTDFRLYPNPAKDNLTVEFTGSIDGNVNVKVYNLSGQIMMYIDNLSVKGMTSYNLNTSNFTSGAYILEIENNGLRQRQKFLISK